MTAAPDDAMRQSFELAHQAAEAAARQSYGKLVAFLAARTGDVALAEDALSEAFASALIEWPAKGVPGNPPAWLLTVARRRMIDALRHQRLGDGVAQELAWLFDELDTAADSAAGIPDERLRLMFACAHPALDAAVRAPLMLQATLGFDAASIASAFLVSPATMGQRLVRAKAKIRQARIPFVVPDREELPERLATVLDAVYATFAEGWSDPAGTDARQRNRAEEGLWLGRVLASLLPERAEALGLLALMLHAHARRGTGRTDWPAIEQLYGALLALTGSPVVAINRAIAVAHTRGAAAGLAALEGLSGETRLADYQPFWAARAELFARAGEAQASAQAFERCIGLERDPAVRRFLQRRLADVQGQ